MDRYGDLAEDLRQVADTAIWQYAPRAPGRHSGYLTSCALGACKRLLRDTGYMIRLPGKLLEAGQRPPMVLLLGDHQATTNDGDVEGLALAAVESEQRWTSLGLKPDEVSQLRSWADDQTQEEITARLGGPISGLTGRIRGVLRALPKAAGGRGKRERREP